MCRLQILQYSQGQYYINVNPKIIDYHLQVPPDGYSTGEMPRIVKPRMSVQQSDWRVPTFGIFQSKTMKRYEHEKQVKIWRVAGKPTSGTPRAWITACMSSLSPASRPLATTRVYDGQSSLDPGHRRARSGMAQGSWVKELVILDNCPSSPQASGMFDPSPCLTRQACDDFQTRSLWQQRCGPSRRCGPG